MKDFKEFVSFQAFRRITGLNRARGEKLFYHGDDPKTESEYKALLSWQEYVRRVNHFVVKRPKKVAKN